MGFNLIYESSKQSPHHKQTGWPTHFVCGFYAQYNFRVDLRVHFSNFVYTGGQMHILAHIRTRNGDVREWGVGWVSWTSAALVRVKQTRQTLFWNSKKFREQVFVSFSELKPLKSNSVRSAQLALLSRFRVRFSNEKPLFWQSNLLPELFRVQKKCFPCLFRTD